jgi:3-oxoacid CoA-transferase subunit B
VNRIITDLGVLDITDERLVLVECTPGVHAKAIITKADAELTVADGLK